MKKYKAVIWDLDGTLLDTSVGVLKSIGHTLKMMDKPALSLEDKLLFIGPPVKSSFINVCHLNEDEATTATEIFRKQYSEIDLFFADVYQGIFEVLDYLKTNKYLIGVATYKREDYAKKLLFEKGIGEYCASINGADFDNKLTKADILEKCIENLGINKSEVLLIGDTEHDANGAQMAKVDFLAVLYGYGFKDEKDVDKYKNVGIANSVSEILKVI